MQDHQKKAKTPSESVVIMTELVLPSQINLLNNLLGGQLMHWMDIAGALACKRHAGYEIATIAVDSIEFKHPVHLGGIITITAKLIWAGRTSMKTRITVSCEDVKLNTSIVTNTAYFTFVALDEQEKPTAIPALLPQTEEEKNDFACEQAQYLARKADVKGCSKG